MCVCKCIAVFYFFLANLPPIFRSKMRRVQLVALAKSEHMKKYGANVILKPLMDDIKKLVSLSYPNFPVS